jgi:2-oxoglutarate dehydrogenase E2 component (dihydrolipoamide succinyltransferase)
MTVELKVPTAGESITEVQIGEWLKGEGDYVERDEALVEIETDKASMELPAPVSGFLRQRLKPVGEIVPVGTVIALVEEAERPAGLVPAHAPAAPPAPKTTSAEPRVMPAARRALAEAGLQPPQVRATGPGGRLLKENVQRHVAEARLPSLAGRGQGEGAVSEVPSPIPSLEGRGVAAAAAPVSGDRQEEVVPMTMLRRRIAQRLVEARQTMAMLTTFNEVDMSAVLRLRQERGDEFQKRYNVRLGFMSFFVKAAIDALKQFPAVNAEIRGDDIVYKNYYDIGIAVSTDHGLVVPVVRNAERLSFAEIEQSIADLAARARDRKIAVEELQGGTFTITNGGVFGSLLATPIINPPQVAILGLHAVQDRPVARDGQVVIRPMTYIALTYDHRLIDGRESVTFLKRIKECVEDPPRMLIEA